jgi:hypothetical protein
LSPRITDLISGDRPTGRTTAAPQVVGSLACNAPWGGRGGRPAGPGG